MENLVGRQFGSYRIVAPLGEGGMAAVYKAYHASVDRYVALKVLPSYFAHDPQFVGRFHQEAKILAKLQHPNILPVYDFGEHKGYTYIVMPLVEAGSLSGLLGKGRLPWSQIQRVISQVGSALDYAHAQGAVHRDVKPSNILIDQHNNCLLTDFGIAKMVESASAFTQTGGILGTPAYMSPEQIRGEQLDGRSDIYSLGIVLYEMATGRPPFRAETPPAIFVKHLHDPLPPPHLYQADIPADVERVVLKALAKDREDRFQTAVDMAAALAQAIAAESVAEPGPAPEPVPDLPPAAKRIPATEVMVPTRPKARSPRWLVPVAGVFALAAVASLLMFVFLLDRDQPAPTVEPPTLAASGPTVAPTAPPAQAPAPQPTAAQPVAAEPATAAPAEELQLVFRVRFESSSDWAQAELSFSPPGAHILRSETIETGGQPTVAAFEDSTLRLDQELEQAEAAEMVYLIEELAFVDLQADQQLEFSLTHGCLGQVVLEVQNMVSGSPITIARLVSEDEEGCGPTPNSLGVAVADLLAASPPPTLAPLPTEPPGRAFYNEGLALRDQGEYAEAIASFDEAEAMGWVLPELYVQRACTCREWFETSGGCDLARVIVDWTTATELEPGNATYYAERGWTYLTMGEFGRCVASFAQAVELDPEHAHYWRSKGICLSEMGDTQAALADYNRAIELDPDEVGTYNDRAWTLVALGEMDPAIADWTRMIELEPDVAYHWYERAWAYSEIGDYDAARNDYEMFLQMTEGEADLDEMRAEIQQWLDSH
jgi:tetratricopeptide (TPR) repeat protein/predicted Ser/Thr protein kinase